MACDDKATFRCPRADVRASENAGLREQRAGLEQHSLDVDAYGVEHREEVLGAEQGVCQGEPQRGGDEASAVLHHPRPGAPLDRRGLADTVYDGVTCAEKKKKDMEGRFAYLAHSVQKIIRKKTSKFRFNESPGQYISLLVVPSFHCLKVPDMIVSEISAQ